jgi:hypothetical protein
MIRLPKNYRSGGLLPLSGGGFGELTPAALAGSWQKVYDQTRAQFAKPLTYMQLYKVLEPHRVRADTFVATAKTMSSLRADQQTAIANAAYNLTQARNAAKVGYANTPNAIAPNQAAALEAALAPLRWLAGVTGQKLAESNARAQTVRDIKKAVVNSPGDALNWARDQLQTGLGIPRWLIPVGLGAAALVVVYPYARPLLAAAKRKAAAI